MRVQITVSIASANWSYVPGQIVTIGGEEYTPEAIPDDVGAAWLEGGHCVPLVGEPETATRKVKKAR